MINVEFFSGINGLCGFEATGHSMSADSGEDIICAFVSSACLMAANTVTEIIGLDCDAQSDDGYLKLMILENSAKAQDVLKGLFSTGNTLFISFINDLRLNLCVSF